MKPTGSDQNIRYLRKYSAAISPYRAILNMQRTLIVNAWTRLKWDVRSVARVSQNRLAIERGRYLNKKAVILCNGPSLLKTDFDSLKSTFTFGLNKINLLFSKERFRPSCIVAVNRLVLQQNSAFFNMTTLPLYLSHKGSDIIEFRPNIRFLHMVNSDQFARDVSGSVNEGATVTFVALQIAFHLGFTKVAIVGCDHHFAVGGTPNTTVMGVGEDKSHFDPNYFGAGIPWQLPDLEASEVSYRLAKNVYEAFDRKIVNCTEGGKLEVFPRVSLAEFLTDEA